MIIAGVVMMVVTGINVVTEKEVLDIGSVEITKEENNPISWSPIIGAVLLVGGVIVLMLGTRKTVA